MVGDGVWMSCSLAMTNERRRLTWGLIWVHDAGHRYGHVQEHAEGLVRGKGGNEHLGEAQLDGQTDG
jgi:hypothetical protein